MRHFPTNFKPPLGFLTGIDLFLHSGKALSGACMQSLSHFAYSRNWDHYLGFGNSGAFGACGLSLFFFFFFVGGEDLELPKNGLVWNSG